MELGKSDKVVKKALIDSNLYMDYNTTKKWKDKVAISGDAMLQTITVQHSEKKELKQFTQALPQELRTETKRLWGSNIIDIQNKPVITSMNYDGMQKKAAIVGAMIGLIIWMTLAFIRTSYLKDLAQEG